jgi:hypothetical protein
VPSTLVGLAGSQSARPSAHTETCCSRHQQLIPHCVGNHKFTGCSTVLQQPGVSPTGLHTASRLPYQSLDRSVSCFPERCPDGQMYGPLQVVQLWSQSQDRIRSPMRHCIHVAGRNVDATEYSRNSAIPERSSVALCERRRLACCGSTCTCIF